MEILDTSSKQCKIVIQDGKKYIIRYPREIGKTVEYYRSTPENEVIKVLQYYNVKCPKILHIGKDYSVQECIEGQLLSDKFEDHKDIDRDIINQIINEICFLTQIDGKILLKYASWKNNSSFYNFQCQNTEKVFLEYYKKLKPIYDKLNISPDILSHLYNNTSKISDDRKLSVIHGDRHKKNAILSNDGELTFIDWELGCIGDVAYDIGFHLHQMAYTKSDEEYFFEQLRKNFKGDTQKLLNDVELYRMFILVRSMLYHVYWTDLIYQSNNKVEREKQLGHFMRRYNKLSKYECFKLQPKSQGELNCIFEEYRKYLEDSVK